ncbi:MAG: XRE family transcriptional regulator [Candidatus Latescibacteria bacterium]|nr:XRE family transcriptional regulator [Candidatus Latescibacterota bacterium]
MSVLTKKRPTENTLIRARITLPVAKWAETRKALRALKVKIEEEDELIPWREAFPDLKDEDMPGLHLQTARNYCGLTQVALSQKTGIPQRHLSEMENGKRPIGKKLARTLAEILKTNYRFFL